MIEDKPPASNEELCVAKKVVKKKADSITNLVELEATIIQQRMERDTLQNVNKASVLENLGLKHKVVEMEKEQKDMRTMIRKMSTGSKIELDQIKLMFMSKKT